MNARMPLPAAVDDPLAEGPASERVDRVLRSVRDFASLSQALRIVGALVMLASLSVFLLQSWNAGNDIQRYLLLLAQTGLLTAGGFALSYGLKENKGARVFFGLALISVSANFTILGALLYSVVQWDGALVAYPEFASWRLVSAGGAGLTLAGALVALVPVTVLGFAIMARRSFKPLTLHFLLLNALLLLPVRTSVSVGLLGFAAAMYALFWTRRLSRNDKTLATPEGKFALTTFFIPVVIVLFRSMYFYTIDSLLVAMLMLVVFFVMRQLSLVPDRDRRVAAALDVGSIVTAFAASLATASALAGVLADPWLAPAFSVVFALLSMDVAHRASSTGIAGVARGLASVMLALCFVFNVAGYPGPLTAVACVLLGVALAAAGHGMKNGLALLLGYVTAIAGAVFGVAEFADLIRRAGWVELALFGAGTIAVGSVLDRHGAAIRLRLSHWFTQLRQTAD